jgi:hypothetical protein
MGTPSATARRALPGAIAVGPQKTGTTWIHEYLASRGDVALPRRVKEVNYFSRYYDRGLEWYARRFPASGSFALTAEVSPSYFDPPEVPDRVAASLGRPKIVVTLRHPAERLHSLWIHMRRYGMTTLPLRQALEHHPEMLESSRYADHLERWYAAVGRANVSVLFLEDLRADSETFAKRLCDCLGLEHGRVPAGLDRKVNEASLPKHPRVAKLGWRAADRLRTAGLHGLVETAKGLGLRTWFFGRPDAERLPSLDPRDRRWLVQQLAPQTNRVEKLLGIELPGWRR